MKVDITVLVVLTVDIDMKKDTIRSTDLHLEVDSPSPLVKLNGPDGQPNDKGCWAITQALTHGLVANVLHAKKIGYIEQRPHVRRIKAAITDLIKESYEKPKATT